MFKGKKLHIYLIILGFIFSNLFLATPKIYAQGRSGGGNNWNELNYSGKVRVTITPSIDGNRSDNNRRSSSRSTYNTHNRGKPAANPPTGNKENPSSIFKPPAYPSPDWKPSHSLDKNFSTKSSSQNTTPANTDVVFVNEHHNDPDRADKNFSAINTIAQAAVEQGKKPIVLIEGKKQGEWQDSPLPGLVKVAGLDEPTTHKAALDANTELEVVKKEFKSLADKSAKLAERAKQLGEQRISLDNLKKVVELQSQTAFEEYLATGNNGNSLPTQTKLEYETTLAKYTSELTAFSEVVKKHNLETSDFNKINQELNERFNKINPIYIKAQQEREDKWLGAIQTAKEQGYGPVIAVVGLGHGENRFGLLDKLSQKGYQWSSLIPNNDIERLNDK